MAQPKKPIIDLPPRDLTLAALDKARKERLGASPPLTNVKAGAGMLSSSGVGGSTGGGSGGGGGGGGGGLCSPSFDISKNVFIALLLFGCGHGRGLTANQSAPPIQRRIAGGWQ